MSCLRLHVTDNVDIVLAPFKSRLVTIPAGHKLANQDIQAGQPVVKFGQLIGLAVTDIAAGDHVHSHNCQFDADYAATATRVDAALPAVPQRQTFMGYRRHSGRAGTRNYIAIIATVHCTTAVCRSVADRANRDLLPDYPGLDGFMAITHDSGCGMAGPDSEAFMLLQRTLDGYCQQPNFAAVLMIGLGCEVNQTSHYNRSSDDTYAQLNVQHTGGSANTIATALKMLVPLAEQANQASRQSIPVSELVVGLQCGGSDGFSGLTANPALGVASDLLVAAGGTSLLAETPELFGAEHLLACRAAPGVADKLDRLLAWWRQYAQQNQVSLDNNPSPGNKQGGITTILEKSLGAVAKAGQAPLTDVVAYAERPARHGLIFMDSPGYDPVSITGQIASGATLIAFTTGRGSCLGPRPTPTLKLSSTSSLFKRMGDDMDIDCGVILTQQTTLKDLGVQIYHHLLDIASGQRTSSEELGLNGADFTPWKLGAVL